MNMNEIEQAYKQGVKDAYKTGLIQVLLFAVALILGILAFNMLVKLAGWTTYKPELASPKTIRLI